MDNPAVNAGSITPDRSHAQARTVPMTPTRGARLISLFALVAMAGAGCTDHESPTAPVATPGTASLAVNAKRPRVPYISDLQLSSIYVSISGGSTPYTVTVTNPSQKDFQSIYLKGELQSQNNQPPLPASAFLAYCPNPNGIVPNGDCTMSDG